VKDRHYNARAIETKWQVRWENERAYRAESHPKGPTYFVLVFPPYPNGQIHMGHVRNYTIGDVVARYERMTGRSVLHPIGFDAFGLPNEIEATRQAIEPEQLTRRNIKTMARQLRRLGFSYDWSKAWSTGKRPVCSGARAAGPRWQTSRYVRSAAGVVPPRSFRGTCNSGSSGCGPMQRRCGPRPAVGSIRTTSR
jgi:valyl-tRNA synthetase